MMIDTLLEMLSYARPKDSATCREFCARFLQPLPGAYVDKIGNWHVPVPGWEESRTLFSSHTDTVHAQEGRVKIVRDGDRARLTNKARRKGRVSCLGGDDTVGVYLMREMILAGRPGWYTFHYGEERGGIGSSKLAMTEETWLKRFTYAIAFDRRGTEDIITRQAGGRCASDEFALALAAELNGLYPEAFKYKPCQGGIFTDTANYAKLIPECTNISVGYSREHTAYEEIDLRHVDKLRDAVLRMPIGAWPAKRDPLAVEVWTPKYYSGYRGAYTGGAYQGEFDWHAWEFGGGAMRGSYTEREIERRKLTEENNRLWRELQALQAGQSVLRSREYYAARGTLTKAERKARKKALRDATHRVDATRAAKLANDAVAPANVSDRLIAEHQAKRATLALVPCNRPIDVHPEPTTEPAIVVVERPAVIDLTEWCTEGSRLPFYTDLVRRISEDK